MIVLSGCQKDGHKYSLVGNPNPYIFWCSKCGNLAEYNLRNRNGGDGQFILVWEKYPKDTDPNPVKIVEC